MVDWTYFISWLGNDKDDFICHLRQPEEKYKARDPEYFVMDAFLWKSTPDEYRWRDIAIRWSNHLSLIQHGEKNQRP